MIVKISLLNFACCYSIWYNISFSLLNGSSWSSRSSHLRWSCWRTHWCSWNEATICSSKPLSPLLFYYMNKYITSLSGGTSGCFENTNSYHPFRTRSKVTFMMYILYMYMYCIHVHVHLYLIYVHVHVQLDIFNVLVH